MAQHLSVFQAFLHLLEENHIDAVHEFRGRLVVAFPCRRPLHETVGSIGHRANSHPRNLVAHVCLRRRRRAIVDVVREAASIIFQLMKRFMENAIKDSPGADLVPFLAAHDLDSRDRDRAHLKS